LFINFCLQSLLKERQIQQAWRAVHRSIVFARECTVMATNQLAYNKNLGLYG